MSKAFGNIQAALDRISKWIALRDSCEHKQISHDESPSELPITICKLIKDVCYRSSCPLYNKHTGKISPPPKNSNIVNIW